MYTRHNEVPVYEYRQGQLEASVYNTVRIGLKRLNQQLRMPLTGLKTLELIVQNDAWIVVDKAFNDVPVIAWTKFERLASQGLHHPVKCEIRLYHANAGILLKRVLTELEAIINQRIHQGEQHTVLNFPTKR